MLNEEQLREFTAAPETPPLTDEEKAKLEKFYPTVFKNEEVLAGSTR